MDIAMGAWGGGKGSLGCKHQYCMWVEQAFNWTNTFQTLQ